MDEWVFEKYTAAQVTEELLREAAWLFSEHYGVWSADAAKNMGKPLQAGSHVRLTVRKLRADHLSDDKCSYARITINHQLAANAFACRWTFQSQTICWVTQLVVHRDHRKRGLATTLLNKLREGSDNAYGIMSSQPAACAAAARAFGSSIESICLDFIKNNAQDAINTSPIGYVKTAVLRGSLFDAGDSSGSISSVDTKFFVDHEEPFAALAVFQQSARWPLGHLQDGDEYLLLLEAN